MKVLVIGSGGREHAICWHLSERGSGHEIYCAPGNVGIERHATLVPIAVDEIQALADFATDLQIDLTIVGPELPLSLGLVDEFRNRGLPVYGPSRSAAELEASKIFAKEFMQRHDVPTADFEIAHDAQEAKRAVEAIGLPLVMKADGLAAGKGVLIVRNQADLDEAMDLFYEQKRFGASGARVLVEPFIVGEEVSFMGFCDGQRFLPLATSKDYKRIGEGDVGANTGGMGAHSPSGIVDAEQSAEVLEKVMRATVAGMAAEGNPFIGILYAGLMMSEDGPKVLEFNVRLGDPEAQALLLRLDQDLGELLLAGARGDFGTNRLDFRQEAACCLVLAAEGYPESAVKGAAIQGLDAAAQQAGVEIFHAGTKAGETEGSFVVSGGRVLNVCATGRNLRTALKKAYDAAKEIRWPGLQIRSDIGKRVVEAESMLESGIFKLPKT
ncbi:MAG: phosphoribosylamine--glycine ligase [Acidobacteriota bacterium]